MGHSTDIWMPLYIGDYLASTQHLTAEQSGGYLHLLMHEWKTGPLPLDTEVLRRISRIDRDAWALLEQFFTRTDAGFIQERLEREKTVSQEKRAVTSARAKAAADKRWKSSNSDAPNIAEALLVQSPSPSPSPSPLRKKPSRKSESDPRHGVFRDHLASYWNHKNPSLAMPWDASEGKQLASLLSANPSLDEGTFKELLRARAKSEVNHSQRPRTWLAEVASYAGGPLNKFKNKLEEGNGQFKGKTESTVDSARRAIEAIENRDALGSLGHPPAGQVGDRRLSRLCG